METPIVPVMESLEVEHPSPKKFDLSTMVGFYKPPQVEEYQPLLLNSTEGSWDL